ncbi:uncharacterized protein SCHCODRAFT_01109319 [Schizophyllum commune H4-8]|uniref:DUF6534 domain-containing protein n=1 Tax=Schizophyllum commune (strain H4-8 / FGSC 9210) TaxID=578458 RepID=D8QKB0_SCHCM|nr:uncharacterized protein SCHCODRAFT_01109319 [Schizophyllum commune H4-8]KAI5885039.1 hypothetical protein SCHCODRAFT_01109319 [Schizophyllum commune H4-8]
MATSAPSTPSIPDVRTSLGPILISSVLSWILWGMLTMQVIRYYLSYQRDSSVMKSMVGLVRLPSDVAGLTNGPATRSPPFAAVWYLSTMIGRDPTKGVGHDRRAGFLLLEDMEAYVPVALYVRAYDFATNSFGNVSAAQRRFFLDLAGFGYLAAVFVADLTMAGLLTALLYRQHLKTPLKNTSEMLRRLLYFSINTGTWTAVFALLAIILSIRPVGDAYYWTMFDVAVCGIYSNTLLVNLNGRDYIVGEEAITLSFLKPSGDESSLTAGDSSNIKGDSSHKAGDLGTKASILGQRSDSLKAGGEEGESIAQPRW